MAESFAQLYKESQEQRHLQLGSIIKATIVDIQDDKVIVDAGLKSDSLIAAEQFYNNKGELLAKVGDEVDVAIDMLENGFGETVLSREKARRAETWVVLETAHENNDTVTGVINGKVKGGFTVELSGVRAFLPGSLVDVRPVRDTSYLENKELEFKIIKIDRKRNNVVVSRRSVVEQENSAERQGLLEKLHDGQELVGIVKNLTDYGAFIDLGGIDGLLHITDMSWKRIKHPSELVNVGDEISVKILKFDREKNRVSLGMKQMGDDPWSNLVKRYPIGSKLTGKVTNITDYGCFVELETGIEGLVHVSEMDWTNKNIHPSKLVQLGEDVNVMVLDIDEERRRISLGIKQCMSNPWQAFADSHNRGDHIVGSIKSITDFGIFIGLDGNIDGLIHLSDLSWTERDEVAVRQYSKGDEVEAVILSIDPERERISLGIKQLSSDSFLLYTENHPKNSIVTGSVIEVEPKIAVIELDEGITGQLKASEISRDKIDDARNELSVGDEVEAKVIHIDRRNRTISLSIKAKDSQDEAEALKKYSSEQGESTANTTLGDLLKNTMESSQSDAE